MNLPILPTDNLYKFLAFAGLVLLVISLTYPTAKVIDLHIAVIEADAQLARLEVQREAVERSIEGLEKAKQPAAQDVISVREMHEKRKLMTIELEKSLKLLSYQLDWVQLYNKGSIFGSILGTLLTILGFRLWYVRIQRPQDRKAFQDSREQP